MLAWRGCADSPNSRRRRGWGFWRSRPRSSSAFSSPATRSGWLPGDRDRRRRPRARPGRRVSPPARRRVCARLAARSRGVEWALGRLVGRARPLVGRAQPDARVRRLRAARPRPRRAVRAACLPGGRRTARRRVRRGDRLGACRQGDPGPVRGRRQGGPVARPDRLLERPRARGGRAARPRALGRSTRSHPRPSGSRRRRSPSARSSRSCSRSRGRGSSLRSPGSGCGSRSTTAGSSGGLPRSPSPCPRFSSRPGPSRAMRSSRTDRSIRTG